MRCRVCRHEERASIESACASSAIEAVASRYGVSELSLERHMRVHVGAQLDDIEAPSSPCFAAIDAPPTERCPMFGEVAPSSRIRRVVLEALERHPEARAEVEEALERAGVAA